MENDWENINFPKVGYSQTNIAIFQNGPGLKMYSLNMRIFQLAMLVYQRLHPRSLT